MFRNLRSFSFGVAYSRTTKNQRILIKKILGDFSESFFCENYVLRLICKPLYFAYLHFCKKWGGPILQKWFFLRAFLVACIGAKVKTFAPLRSSAFGAPLAGGAVAAGAGFFPFFLSLSFFFSRRIFFFKPRFFEI